MKRMPDNVRFEWRTVAPNEAEAVYRVHREALAGIAPGLVRPDTLEHFVAHTGPCGVTLGCFADDIGMVAYGVLGISSATAAHMTHMFAVEKTSLHRFAILDGAASLPGWRGHHLHRESIRARLAYAAQAGRTLLGATVAPGNFPSLHGLLEAQFRISRFAMLYGGLPRLILRRDLSAPASQWVLRHKVAAADIRGHDMALAEGLTGFASSKDADGNPMVDYGVLIVHQPQS